MINRIMFNWQLVQKQICCRTRSFKETRLTNIPHERMKTKIQIVYYIKRLRIRVTQRHLAFFPLWKSLLHYIIILCIWLLC